MSKLKIYACSGVGSAQSNRVAQELENSGWMLNDTLRKYLGTSKDGGCAEYFLYTFIPESELGKYNAVIYNKRKQQLKTFAYVRELFVGHGYGTEAEMVDVIRKGIETTFGMPVESVLSVVRSGGRVEGVGIATEIVVAIISAVVSIVIAVVSGIIAYCQNVKIAKYTAPTMQELEDSVPEESDFLGSTKKKGLLFAVVAAAGVALYKIFK